MEHTMFCFQCEQTAGCTGCTGKAGACGKSAGTAKLQDELTGALIGLARATDHAARRECRHMAASHRGSVHDRYERELSR